MTNALFTAAQLSNSIHETVSADEAAVAEQTVWGWISGATELVTRPDQVPDDLFAWALELGGIAWRNGLSQKTVGQTTETWRDDMARRAQILADLAASNDAGGGVGGPQFCFPPAQCWPDPIRVGPIGPVSDATRQAALDWWNG